jgi:hypothetical protein
MIQLHAIQFHDPTKNVTFPLRRSETGGSQYRPPEWIPGKEKPEDAPVAYRQGSQEIGLVIFFARKDPAGAADFEVWAEDESEDRRNFIGSIGRTRVSFPAAPGPSFEAVPVVSSGSIPNMIGSHNDCLGWKAKPVGAPDSEIFVLGTTKHRIYSVLAQPADPWDIDETCPVRWVWTTVLDLATEWAKGCTDVDTAATKITEQVHALGMTREFKYNSAEPARFARDLPFSFDCAQFVHAATGALAGRDVNVDCLAVASIVVTVANSLGCGLNVASMLANRSTSDIVEIGGSRSGTAELGRHDFAVLPVDGKSDKVWDACFQLVSRGSTKPIAGLPFDVPGHRNSDYVGLLLRRNGVSLKLFRDKKGNVVNRAVMCRAPFPDVVPPLKIVEERLSTEVFEKRFLRDDAPQSRLFVHNFFWSDDDLRALGLRLFEKQTHRDPYRAMEALWVGADDPFTPVLRTTLYEGASRDQAREIFAARLNEFGGPVEVVNDVGEVAFRSRTGEYTVAFAANIVWTCTAARGSNFNAADAFRTIAAWIHPPEDGTGRDRGPDAQGRLPLPLSIDGRRVWYLLKPQNGVLTRDTLGVMFTANGPGLITNVLAKPHHSAGAGPGSTTIEP